MDVIAELAKTLGSFRAENLGDRVFALYTKPAYFPELLTPTPCMLMGGRGSGKTTVLKSLSYEGQYRLSGELFKVFNKENYIGIYYKLETGLVSAFSGAGREIHFWQGLFSHFVNLQLCKQICEFALWFEQQQNEQLQLNSDQFRSFCVSFGLDCQTTLSEVRNTIDLEIAKLESSVNSAADNLSIRQTAIGAPIRRLIRLLRNTPQLSNKIFYFLLDEYENLRDYQQSILNTFIKQADEELTFKIGIRELGLKTRHTLNEDEKLVDPADYVLIKVSERLSDKEFDEFATNVLESRFEELQAKGIPIPASVKIMFETLSENDEAVKLGGKDIAREVEDELRRQGSPEELEKIGQFSVRDLVLFQFLAQGQKDNYSNLYSVFKEAILDPVAWSSKVNNYGYACLFTIRRRKVGITKYYCGWQTFLSLSGHNIRYLLQLVTNSLIDHVKSNKSLNQQISADCQTKVAIEVGKKNLYELEGLSTRGAQLMKLVLGLGQVFHEMAIQPEGHTPEITQFQLTTKNGGVDEFAITQVDELLNAAVMHLALLRSPGTKLGAPGDTKDFDYMLHPVFSPFFVYSHRRKRKFYVTPDELLGITTMPSSTIKSLLNKQNRVVSADLPEQLRLFGGFYEGNN